MRDLSAVELSVELVHDGPIGDGMRADEELEELEGLDELDELGCFSLACFCCLSQFAYPSPAQVPRPRPDQGDPRSPCQTHCLVLSLAYGRAHGNPATHAVLSYCPG